MSLVLKVSAVRGLKKVDAQWTLKDNEGLRVT